jgi:AcrR family transcriptional regulator
MSAMKVTTAAPSRPRSAKGARTRQRLLDSAKTVFEREGFLSARISDIAKGAGTSHGSFYHYFDSKEEIFREVAAKQEVSLLSAHTVHEHVPEDSVERIRRGNRAYLEAYKAQAKIMRVIEEVSRYDAEVYRIREIRQQDFGESLARSIARLQDSGLADPHLDPHIVATVLGGMVNKISEMVFVQHYADIDVETLTDQLTRIWASALGLKAAEGDFTS